MTHPSHRSVLITGGMGLIGPALVKRFLSDSVVTVVDRLDCGLAPELEPLVKNKTIEFIESDLVYRSPIFDRIQRGEFDIIVHLAAFPFIPFCNTYPDFAYLANVIPSINILFHAPKDCRVILFSTSSTYAPDEKFHIEGESELRPIDVYGWTKKHVEDLAHFYAASKGLSSILIRLANAVGYGETTPRIFEAILRQIQSGVDVVELGNLSPKRDYIHVDDVAWVVDQLSLRWPVAPGTVETFNLGTGYPPISVKELFDKIVACVGRPVELRSVKERRREADRAVLCVDSKKLFSVLPDFKPKTIDEWLPTLVKDAGLRPPHDPERIVRKWYDRKG